MPRQAANGRVPLSALVEEAIEVEIVSPSGKRTKLHMRPLTHSELLARDRLFPLPTAPLGDMVRNQQTLKIERVMNENDPVYLEKRDEAVQLRASAALLSSLTDLDVPGETEQERVQHFHMTIQMWAKQQLFDVFNRMNGFTPETIKEAETEVTPLDGGSMPSSPVLVGAASNGTL